MAFVLNIFIKTKQVLIEMKMFESFIIFDQKYCRQCHGIAMDSPLEPTLANVFICHFEKIWLENCPA